MALFNSINKNTNMTDSGGRKKKEPETPTPPADDKGLVDYSDTLKSLQDQIADLQARLQSGGNSGTPNTPAYQSGGYNYGKFTPSAYTPQAFNPSGDTDKERANLNSALASRPADFDYDQYGRILGMMQEYQGREPFSYDLNADMLYQQYKNQYMQNGQRAMQDTIGQVSALNGGYASSYAQTAGQQAYNNELGKLNDVIPELYQLAYSQYVREGDEMLKGIELANDAYKTRYGEYRDAMTDWRNDVAQARNAYENQRAFDYNAYQDDLTRQQRQKEFDYQVYADDIARAQKQQAIDVDNYQTALSMAQQNAGNKTTLDATMRALVDRGVIDEATAQNLSGIYSNVTPASSGAEVKYDTVRKVAEDAQGYLSSADALADFLDNAVAQGRIAQGDADIIFANLYEQAEENAERAKEEKMVREGKHAAYRYIE